MEGDSCKLSIHHVGGRGGSRGFPVLPRFEPDVVNVLYDADADCLAQVEEHNRQLGSRTIVLPHCLGARQGSAEFNLNYDPYTSSLLTVNAEYAPFYFFNIDHDYVAGESLRTMQRLCVELTTLDELARQPSPAPPPDFLSIDTQGSELPILAGAEQVLHSHVLALLLEVEFHPLYAGQKLFGDVCDFLRERGFHFVKLAPHGDWSPARHPVGLRGEGFQISGDAFFLRRIDSIASLGDAGSRRLMLEKLAFLSIVHGQIEYALEALAHVPVRTSAAATAWQAFLAEFRDAAAVMRHAPLPPTFGELLSFEASRARFTVAAEADSRPAVRPSTYRRLKQAVRRIPGVHAAERLVREAGRRLRRAAKPAVPSPVERVLRAYGLDEQAETLLRKRLAQSRHARGPRTPAIARAA